jgi:hypothetical protein
MPPSSRQTSGAVIFPARQLKIDRFAFTGKSDH